MCIEMSAGVCIEFSTHSGDHIRSRSDDAIPMTDAFVDSLSPAPFYIFFTPSCTYHNCIPISILFYLYTGTVVVRFFGPVPQSTKVGFFLSSPLSPSLSPSVTPLLLYVVSML